MKAAVYRGVNQIRCEDVPVPQTGPGEVLVNIQACGLCQSDIKKILYPIHEPPRIFGHEMAGVVARVGEGVTDFAVGDRVAVMHHIPCLDCAHCRNECFSMCETYKRVTTTAGFIPSGGGYSEYICAPDHIARHGLIPLPVDISFEEATFIEPVNCCLKAMEKVEIDSGEQVLIVGAGPMGLLFVKLLRSYGATPIVSEPMDARRDRAVEAGAALAVNPANENAVRDIIDFADGMGADAALLAVPNLRAAEFALEAVRKGGRILFFAEFPEEQALPLNPNFLYRSEISLHGSYSSSYKLQALSADLIFSRSIEVRDLISDELSLDQMSLAIEKATGPDERTMKILLRP
ncbi:MAG: alcohol dehydrogenase catalytic domain-containing protein [Planctomycetota bacterium]|jgi:L-iditol 2-dehydrogenase|nr:alcohol dehydrogenase catalytic domain-containing protein [Planctomycetota bacterium]MDP6503295.1 alcohol dehydrogenase catalytic domain-containing protein [Planctomycetota bacterium]